MRYFVFISLLIAAFQVGHAQLQIDKKEITLGAGMGLHRGHSYLMRTPSNFTYIGDNNKSQVLHFLCNLTYCVKGYQPRYTANKTPQLVATLGYDFTPPRIADTEINNNLATPSFIRFTNSLHTFSLSFIRRLPIKNIYLGYGAGINYGIRKEQIDQLNAQTEESILPYTPVLARSSMFGFQLLADASITLSESFSIRPSLQWMFHLDRKCWTQIGNAEGFFKQLGERFSNCLINWPLMNVQFEMHISSGGPH